MQNRIVITLLLALTMQLAISQKVDTLRERTGLDVRVGDLPPPQNR